MSAAEETVKSNSVPQYGEDDFETENDHTSSSPNGKAKDVSASNKPSGKNAPGIITVQPLRRSEMQPSYAQVSGRMVSWPMLKQHNRISDCKTSSTDSMGASSIVLGLLLDQLANFLAVLAQIHSSKFVKGLWALSVALVNSTNLSIQVWCRSTPAPKAFALSMSKFN